MSIDALLARQGAVQANTFAMHLAGSCRLSPEELSLLQDACRLTRAHVARTEIWNGLTSAHSRILISGWACRQRYLGDGRRQIISFLLPGDAVGIWAQSTLQSFTALALTDVVTADASALVRAVAQSDRHFEGLASLMQLRASRETGMLHDHIVRLGRQTAYERMAHLILEFRARLQLAGVVVSETFSMPLSQETLADSLGLSVVHVNRTLMQMRRDELMEIHCGTVRILDLRMMQQLADWESSSLYASSPSAFRPR